MYDFTSRSDMSAKAVMLLIAVVALTIAMRSPLAAQEGAAPIINVGGETTNQPARPSSGGERDTLTGDWGGARSWLIEHGITLTPRLTQFYQGMNAGDGDLGFEYGGKADLLLNADLGKLGFWGGLSITVHAEQNFGQSVNGRGGTIVPVNTALLFPGIEGPDSFDLSSVYLGQTFGDSVSLLFGKINMIDLAADNPFMGGAGIDSFWNLTFASPPTGLVPPYLFGALLSVRTKTATFGLWVYDPNSMVNKSPFDDPFANGITIRGNVDFPVTIAGRSGHQGFVALWSNEPGNDLDLLSEIFLPPFPSTVPQLNSRHYFAYVFDQYLYQSKENPKEGVGLFGQFGISDGNPTRLYWSARIGVGATGLIPGRSRDNWGVGYFYDKPSPDLQESLAPILKIRAERGLEIFYNFALTEWLDLGADLQIIQPSLADETAVFSGLRMVTRF
jgi:porin